MISVTKAYFPKQSIGNLLQEKDDQAKEDIQHSTNAQLHSHNITLHHHYVPVGQIRTSALGHIAEVEFRKLCALSRFTGSLGWSHSFE
jgi:hypothetical protein